MDRKTIASLYADAAWNDFMAFRDEISGEASWLDALTEREVRDLVAARYE